MRVSSPDSRSVFLAALMAVASVLFLPGMASAQSGGAVTGTSEPGIWIDPDGCMHWVADGGVEGYMTSRVNPENGMPICMEMNTCAVANTDTLFATDSSRLTSAGRAHLEQFFTSAGAFAYAIYRHTDSRASDEYNMALSNRRANMVADVARDAGVRVVDVRGFGERQPRADGNSAAAMQQNRRVEVYCVR